MNFDKISVTVGQRIKSVRLSKGITQEQLAENCNVSTNHISSIECGASNFSFSLMISICNFLDITPNFIFADYIHSKNDSIELIDKNILSTYLKLKPRSKDFIDNAINQVYDIQSRK